mmetsp:Transcript_25767/g.46665  ORF Transcript_25767/g.46665 Transcript_25767/m.46665 type:complete len:87 (-) Transcript_25767:40-300(-)
MDHEHNYDDGHKSKSSWDGEGGQFSDAINYRRASARHAAEDIGYTSYKQAKQDERDKKGGAIMGSCLLSQLQEVECSRKMGHQDFF